MISTSKPDVEPPSSNASEPAVRCQMCPHDIAEHDVVGLRYCDATRTSALTRSCLCRV